MAQHNDLGKQGEQLASAFLVAKGYEILDENWCYGKAEVDLIAYINKQIVFVEVKSRTSVIFGQPEEFVSIAKQHLLETAAAEYIAIMNHQGEIRFDIISVLFDKQNNYRINHIEDAFWPYE
ncbi:YraN family protein [Pedobacter namyangjuensis]|uniref:YraN family protein n=1 Tax=Pedobacter namyangjuensis TaxID=600626 RepID=UPI000DE48663|nr:YraN family protein [Pedobacter namyangjuensis]